MKKFIVGIIALSILTACVEDEEIIEKEHEKTKTEINKSFPDTKEDYKKKADSIRTSLQLPGELLEPTDPGEVGPVVTTPPK